MPKEFITEKDIEDMVKRGILSLEVNDNVVLTSLAYEKAGRLGLKLLRDKPGNPPSAPVRPYISKMHSPPPSPAVPHARTPSSTCGCACPADRPDEEGLQQRIRNAVVSRLGTEIDPNLLDVIIRRVLNSTGVK